MQKLCNEVVRKETAPREHHLPGTRPTAKTLEGVTVDERKSSARRGIHRDVDERIRFDAAAHPQRTPSEHVEAARRDAAESYREEIRRLMRAGKL